MHNPYSIIVGLDVDGVLADILTPLMKITSRLIGKKLDVSHVKTWDLDSLFEEHGRPDLVPQLWIEAGSPGFCRTLSPYPNAVEGVKSIRQTGAQIYIVTSPLHDAATWTHDREHWLKESFSVDRAHVVHAHDKSIFAGDILVDDKPANIVHWGERHGFKGAVLWDQPWNQDFDDPRVQRTSSWKAVVDLCNEMKSKRLAGVP